MDSSGDEFSMMERTIVSNEVLSNILRGFLYTIEDEDIFCTIDNCFSNDEVYEARNILIKFFVELFENEEPNGRHMGPKEREIKKDENIFDIIEKMHEISYLGHGIEFCIPWNCSYTVVSHQEKKFLELARQKDLEMDKKIQSLQDLIDKENGEIILAVKSIMETNGNLDRKGEVYIHSPGLEDTAYPKGVTKQMFNLTKSNQFSGSEALQKDENIVCKRRHFDVHILNSLINFVTAAFAVKLVANIFIFFYVNIWLFNVDL